MFWFLKKIFDKNIVSEPFEYLSCRHLQGGITFMHDAIRTCCSHKQGVTFFDNYKGQPIDWKGVYNVRKEVIEKCKEGIIPENCKGCVDLEKKVWDSDSKITELYLNYWDQCNCGCVYCIVGNNAQYLVTEKNPSRHYSVYPHIKQLYENDMISDNVHVELVGGDLTVLDEADDIINLCLDNGVGRMSFHSSCIYYSNGIERALKESPCVDFDFSLDSSNKELYKKIKRIDAFDQVVENVKRYLCVSDKAKDALIAKYIIIDGLNDSVEEVENWLQLIHSIGIKKAKIDINFKRFFPEFHHCDPTVPKHYYDIYNHYNKRIQELGIQDCCWEFSRRVLESGGIPKDY